MSTSRNSIFSLVKKFFFYLISTLIILGLVIWLASAYIISWQANKYLQSYKLQLSDNSKVTVNPFVLAVKIENLALTDLDNKQSFAAIKSAELNVSWLSLASKKLLIETLAFDEVDVLIKRDQQSMQVAGFEIPVENQPKVDEPKQDNSQQEPNDWQVMIPQSSFKKLAVTLNDMGHINKLVLEQLSLNDIVAKLNEQKAKLSINALLNKAPIALSLQANLVNQAKANEKPNYKIVAETDLAIEQLALADFSYLLSNLPDINIEQLSGLLNLSLQQHIELDGDSWLLEQKALDFSLADLVLVADGNKLTHELFSLNLAESKFNGTLSGEYKGQTSFTSQLNKLVLVNQEEQGTVASIGGLNLAEGSINLSSTSLPELVVKHILINDIIASPALVKSEDKIDESEASNELQALFNNKQLEITDIQLKENHLAIDSINLGKFASHIALDKNKKPIGLVLPHLPTQLESGDKAANTEQTKKVEKPVDEEAAKFTFSLAHFSIPEVSEVNFSDVSVEPNFKQKIEITKAQVNQLNSQMPEQAADFDLALKLGQYASTTVKGKVTPFADKLNLTLATDIKEYALPPLSGYLRGALGFDFLSGQLYSKIEVDVVNDKIDGNAHIDIRGLDISGGSDVTGDTVKDTGAVPLNAALSMLKDSNGNVKLDVPLSGNVADPQFGVSSFIALITKKAIMSQAEEYLINTFLPYANVITVARIAGEYLLKVRVENLVYQPQQVKVSAEQQKFITDLVALLKSKPDQALTACAIGVVADLSVEQQKLSEKEQIKLLKAVSKQRAELFKSDLVEQYKVPSSQLLLCAPKADLAKDAKPRIEFNFN